MKPLLFAFFSFFATFACAQKATGNEKQYLTTKDSVFLTMSSEKGKVFEHRIAEKQTLYSISKFYGIPLSELYALNPTLKKNEGVGIGQSVKVTIPNRAIKRYKKKGFKAKEHCKVFYVAKKGDNIQKIAKTYFAMPPDTVKNRNGIKTNEVKEGQKIFIGWMNTHGVPEEKEETTIEISEAILIKKAVTNEVAVPENYETIRKTYMAGRKIKKEMLTQGLAAWDKREKLVPALFNALYRDAPIGATIAVSNPATDKVVFLKVVGTIPTGKYDKKTVVIITPAAAQSLGATAESFATKVRFLK
jgi:LysM repeat protein